MKSESRTYQIAGHRIRVTLESPWTFKALTPEQEKLVSVLREGGDLGILPVPADRLDQLAPNASLMGKQRMTRELWESYSDEDRDAFDERVEGYTQEDLKDLAKSIREEKLGKAGEEIKADDANARKKEEE